MTLVSRRVIQPISWLLQRTLHSSSMDSAKTVSLEQLDPRQCALLDEPCILVDDQDCNIGFDSKKNCHLMKGGTSLLHRAFSVFLFNECGELLVQQRSDAKITFPGHYTNTCCSHPLHTPEETIEKNAYGVRCAAQRRLEIELGIPPHQAEPDDFEYLTRIHYAAPSDGTWGEHELDYILFLRKNVDLNPNLNEVKDVRYVKREQFDDFIEQLKHQNIPITPWFRLIVQEFLPLWWKNLDNLENFVDHETIHRL